MNDFMQSRSSRPIFGLCCALASTLIVACEGNTRPGGTLTEVIPTTYEEAGPDGLKQKLFITPPRNAVDDPKSLIEVESTISNAGALTVQVITRACTLLPGDLISPDGIIFVPENPPDCGDRSADTLALAPGESTPTLTGVFSIEGTSPGVYSVDARHLIKPSFLTRFRFRMPGVAPRG
jgi:hypothetical protein